MGELASAAIRLAEMGYSVFPCKPNEKAPATAHGLKDATEDVEQVRRWWADNPNYNIGLRTDSLIVIDVDGINNPWPIDPEKAYDLASSAVVATTPRGGRHYIFRQPVVGGYRNTTGKIAVQVDTRADGGYILVAPSVVNGGRYEWVDGHFDTLPESLEPLPDWVADLLSRSANTEYRTPNTEQNDELEPIPDGQRNDTLTRYAGAMRRVGMTAAEIRAALQRINIDRCQPPLGPDDIETIARSVARYEPDQISVALVNDHFGQMQEGEAESVEPITPAAVDPGPMPDHLLDVPGFVGDVMRYILATAPCPNPVLAFAGAIALQGFLASRKVAGFENGRSRTNVYLAALAASGTGKDWPRAVNTEILFHAGLSGHLGDTIASGEGLEDRLLETKTCLYQVDEFDTIIKRMSDRDGKHDTTTNALLRLWSDSGGTFNMRTKVGRAAQAIRHPGLTILGTAVPEIFYQSLNKKLMIGGFLSRLLIFVATPRQRNKNRERVELPESIKETAAWWAQLSYGAGNLAAENPTPRVMTTTDEAEARLTEHAELIELEYKQAEADGNEIAMALWSRVVEKASRLAMIYAVSADREATTIGAEAIDWAIAVAAHSTRLMIYLAETKAPATEFEEQQRKFLNTIQTYTQKHGEGMPGLMLRRAIRWDRRTFDSVVESLSASGQLSVESSAGGRGRPGKVYTVRGAL